MGFLKSARKGVLSTKRAFSSGFHGKNTAFYFIFISASVFFCLFLVGQCQVLTSFGMVGQFSYDFYR